MEPEQPIEIGGTVPMSNDMNGRRDSNQPEKPTWMLLVLLVVGGVLIFRPQIVGTPLTAFSTWFGYKAAEHIQEDMEEQGFVPTTSTTTP